MGISVNFNELPEKPEDLKEGIYYIEVTDVVSTETSTGKEAFVFEYIIPGTQHKVNDYVIINDENGEPHNFGRRKLRTILETTETELLDITPKTLKNAIVGAVMKANIKINKNGYPEVNYDDFYTKDSPHDTVNEEPKKEASKQVKEATFSEPETEEDSASEPQVNTDDI